MSRPPQTFSPPNLFRLGIGPVMIVRYKSGGRVEAGVFLLDVFCLGVKNALFNQLHEDELPEFSHDMFQGATPDEHSGAWGRKLVEDAAAYARKLGFAPHRDYKKGARVMGGINTKDCTETFVFGCDGKPFYVSGPNESEAKSALIMQILQKKLGHDAFDFMVPLAMKSEEGDDENR
jgi:hypothetical protein